MTIIEVTITASKGELNVNGFRDYNPWDKIFIIDNEDPNVIFISDNGELGRSIPRHFTNIDSK